MYRFFRIVLPLLLVVFLVSPAMAQYYQVGKETMVRVILRYNGPDTSPYLDHDLAKIKSKEATAAKIRGILQTMGGTVGYSFRHVNLVSGSIPLSKLSELSKHPEIIEIAKDRTWEPTASAPAFNPFGATRDERVAFAKQKAKDVMARVKAHPELLGQRMKDQVNKIPELLARKESNTDSVLAKPMRISGVDSTIDPSQVNALLSSKGITPANYLFYNHGTTNASQIWNTANQGDGIIVALIDSGTYSAHPFLSGNVIGGEVAPGLAAIEAAADVDGDGVADGRTPAFDSILNNGHGTGTACMIAGHGAMTFSNSSRFLKAVQYHAPASVVNNGDGTSSILLFGTAPKAKIYAIKVFSYAGGGSPSSIILAGMDRAVDKKQDYLDGKPSGLNIQVVNMSLGGPDLFEGFSAEDKFADSMVKIGIQPVISAGNAGPAPYTISEPGASLKAITVAAASERIHERIAFESSFPELPVGGGEDMRLVNQFIPSQFSSHGPLTTGYGKPDLTAEGSHCLTGYLFDTDGDGLNDTADAAIVAGTSFSAPTTAGAVALLQAYANAKGLPLSHQQPIKAALLAGARPMPGMDEDEVGKGFLDVKGAADYLTLHPDASAGSYNTRKLKFKGMPLFPVAGGPCYTVFYAFTDLLKPGEQDDFLIPTELHANTDENYYRIFYIYGFNPSRVKPFPGVVRDIFDPDLTDGVPPRAALNNNTEIFYADGINTGFSDGDYIVSSLNMVDTYVYAGPLSVGLLATYPELFPSLTLGFAGFIADPVTGALATSGPSGYAQFLPSQQFGTGGRPDYDRLSFIGDNTNDGVSPVANFTVIVDVNRSGVFPFGAGQPSFSGSIKQNEVKTFNINLPAPSVLPGIFGYFFRTSFTDGWNAYKYPADPLGVGLTGIKRKTADIGMYVTAPDGSLLNLSGFPGIFQGDGINDVEGILDLDLFKAGKYTIELVGWDVKGVPNNTVPFEVRIWDFLIPIVP